MLAETKRQGSEDEVSKGKTCLTPGCGKQAKWKCLCHACYGQAKRLIDSEETSWEELADLNLACPPSQLFRMAFRLAKAAQGDKALRIAAANDATESRLLGG